MVELEEHSDAFRELGIALAAMTYDSVEVLAGFHSEESLSYPLLRDEDAKHVNALGILNDSYEQGHQAYGIPHPGVLYVDAEGVIRAKYAIRGFRNRPPFEALLDHLQGLVAAQTPG